MKRNELLGKLATASIDGNLGLFVGTGFSMALATDEALSFGDLLKKIARKMKLSDDFTKAEYLTKSYPQIASTIISKYAKANSVLLEEAEQKFKKHVADACCFHPDPKLEDNYKNALAGIQPSWIVTTNYDQILESLLKNCMSKLPGDALHPSTNCVPVYHLHGHRHLPDSICITEEDYVDFVAPLDYINFRLPLLFVESATLMLGYSLGDINIRAAMKLADSFTASDIAKKPLIAQAYYKESGTAKKEPYIGADGQWIIETKDVAELLDEIVETKEKKNADSEQLNASICKFLQSRKKPGLISENDNRLIEFIEIIKQAQGSAYASLIIDFMNQALDPIWKAAVSSGGFPLYAEYLRIVIEVVKATDHVRAHPAVMRYLADALNKVGPYISADRVYGTSFDASELWLNEKDNISAAMKHELRVYSWTSSRHNLNSMLRMK